MYIIVEWDPEDLGVIQKTWERLTEHHASVSTYFKNYFSDYPFEVRRAKLDRHAQGGLMKIDLVMDETKSHTLGHCVSIIDSEGKGELESIYVDEIFRKNGCGQELMKRAIAWFEANHVNEFAIEVALGNEEALVFYEKFGYQPFSYNLKKKY
jgi:GNAT superfamily N-acetyltransferase